MALLVGAVPVTVLPRPLFPGPVEAPKPGRIHFVLVSSTSFLPGSSGGFTGTAVPNWAANFRGLPLQQVTGTLAIYGRDGSSGRYVVSPGHYAFDFAKYAWPPRYVRSERAFVYEQVVWAREADTGVLYVETAHSTYARSSYGLNGYLNAIDLKTKRLLWRSAARVANANEFVMLNTVLISGYGFTDEPDYLYAIDRRNGHVLARLLLPTMAETIKLHGRTLTVRTYDHLVTARLVGA